jgi:hypothetical protein
MEHPGDWVLDELNKRVIAESLTRKIVFRPSDRQTGNCTTSTPLANLTTPFGHHDPCPLQLTM